MRDTLLVVLHNPKSTDPALPQCVNLLVGRVLMERVYQAFSGRITNAVISCSEGQFADLSADGKHRRVPESSYVIALHDNLLTPVVHEIVYSTSRWLFLGWQSWLRGRVDDLSAALQSLVLLDESYRGSQAFKELRLSKQSIETAAARGQIYAREFLELVKPEVFEVWSKSVKNSVEEKVQEVRTSAVHMI